MTQRNALARALREQAKAWPVTLALVPESELPPRPKDQGPLSVWRSRYYLATVWPEPPHGDVVARRLTVNRVTVSADGQWEQNIPWEELMRCKRETGHGDWYGVEVYPRDEDIVNMANMRHLWLFEEPLDIGWFTQAR